MNLVDMLMDQNNSAALGQLAKQFNLDQRQTQDVLGQIAPAIAKGFQNNASQGGLEDLMGALSGGQQERYLDDLSALTGQDGVQNGNNILGQIFGSKDVSRQVAAQASQKTGVQESALKQMLPMIASMAMGAMSKNAASRGAAGSQSDMTNMLTGLLDADNDGSVIDDLAGLAGKFFR